MATKHAPVAVVYQGSHQGALRRPVGWSRPTSYLLFMRAPSPPRVGDTYIEAGTRATRWFLREIWRDVCVLDCVSDPLRTRYIYVKDLLRTSRYANENDLEEE
jgi:hypothetical protein